MFVVWSKENTAIAEKMMDDMHFEQIQCENDQELDLERNYFLYSCFIAGFVNPLMEKEIYLNGIIRVFNKNPEKLTHMTYQEFVNELFEELRRVYSLYTQEEIKQVCEDSNNDEKAGSQSSDDQEVNDEEFKGKLQLNNP
jgi:hypothetical protein